MGGKDLSEELTFDLRLKPGRLKFGGKAFQVVGKASAKALR